MAGKILLIRPRNVYNYNNYPPLNLISLATVLAKQGFTPKIINCALHADPFAVLKAELPDALFAGVSLLTSEVPDAYAILKFIKEQFPRVPVVAGGWHCTLFPQQMADCRFVDHVVCGEGEDHVVSIARSLSEGRAPDRKIFGRKFVDLEALPTPDYGLDPDLERFIGNYLTDKFSETARKPMRWLPYDSSRGCPSHCTFCINVVTDNIRYRQKSAAKVIAEIAHIVTTHKLTHLKIIDDNFFVNVQRTRDICRGILDRGLDITWDGECRCDYFNDRMLNDETLALARKSGLVQLTLGIESGSPRTLKIMKKGITPEQAENAVRQCDRHGIIPRSSFMLEVPGETMEDIQQTVSFINRLRRYPLFTCGVGTFRPYPKCELTTQLLAQGHLSEPKDLESWTDRGIIDLYTSAEYMRPWQVNGPYSESVSYYLNMESAVRLGNYQIPDPWDRFKNTLFMNVAKARNRMQFYGFQFDKHLYKKFLTGFYEKRQQFEKSGEYPLAKAE